VLCVDTDKSFNDQLAHFLEREGFDAKPLSDPTKTEAEVRKADYHVMIIDLAMPKLNGLEIIRRIRKIDTDIGIIVVTGHPSLDSAREAIRYAVDGYLAKPVNWDEFRELLGEVVAKKGLARTPEDQLHRVIGNIIRDLRRDKDLTLKDMSRRTGLSVSLLSQIERAESSASISSLYKIAKGLNTKIGSLFGEN
jgi:DNA-binding response OmpR family regulator